MQSAPFEIAVRRIESRISMIENRIDGFFNSNNTGDFRAELEKMLSINTDNNMVQIEDKDAYSSLANIAGNGEDIISGINNSDPKTGKVMQLIEYICNENGVDPKLVNAMVKIESNFDPEATSRCGAMGLMQLMPETAKGLGVDDAYDIYENLNGGIKMIKGLMDRFDQNIKFALAAYNAGSGRVIEHGGIPPIAETEDYVFKILSIYDPALL